MRGLQGRGQPVHFGDGEDPDFLHTLPLGRTRWVITTFPQWESNRALLHALPMARYQGQVAGAVRDAAHGQALAEAGVQRILNPFGDAADHAAERLAHDILATEQTPEDLLLGSVTKHVLAEGTADVLVSSAGEP